MKKYLIALVLFYSSFSSAEFIASTTSNSGKPWYGYTTRDSAESACIASSGYFSHNPDSDISVYLSGYTHYPEYIFMNDNGHDNFNKCERGSSDTFYSWPSVPSPSSDSCEVLASSSETRNLTSTSGLGPSEVCIAVDGASSYCKFTKTDDLYNPNWPTVTWASSFQGAGESCEVLTDPVPTHYDIPEPLPEPITCPAGYHENSGSCALDNPPSLRGWNVYLTSSSHSANTYKVTGVTLSNGASGLYVNNQGGTSLVLTGAALSFDPNATYTGDQLVTILQTFINSNAAANVAPYGSHSYYFDGHDRQLDWALDGVQARITNGNKLELYPSLYKEFLKKTNSTWSSYSTANGPLADLVVLNLELVTISDPQPDPDPTPDPEPTDGFVKNELGEFGDEATLALEEARAAYSLRFDEIKSEINSQFGFSFHSSEINHDFIVDIKGKDYNIGISKWFPMLDQMNFGAVVLFLFSLVSFVILFAPKRS